MKLTILEKQCLKVAIEYSISDYETQLRFLIENCVNKEEIKEQRKLLKGMQRIQNKLSLYWGFLT